MDENIVCMHKLPIGKSALVKQINCSGTKRRRMLDLGIIKNSKVTSVLKSPSGDPIAYQIRGAVIALRNQESKNILVKIIEEE